MEYSWPGRKQTTSRFAETSSPGMGCDSSDSNTETCEFNEDEAERVSGESWWIYSLLSDRLWFCHF